MTTANADGGRRVVARAVDIGCASGFWGDSQIAIPQLLTDPDLGYIVFDYLAETTMSILQRARLKDPALGYATDFVSQAIKPNLAQLMARGIKLVSNAGGLNPQGCRDAVLAVARAQGLEPIVAVVTGDDVLGQVGAFRAFPDSNEPAADIPGNLLSANAYFGAGPIAEALRGGADIVITGRCVDSAVVTGICMAAFGWSAEDYDRLAQGSLAGHLVECGAQATGGLFTDWETVPDWANIGYPIVRIESDGSFELRKPAGTGGRIDAAVATEQLLYEIGDPGAYELPDVVCDFTQVEMAATGPNRLRITGARGAPPSDCYKVTTTYPRGFQLALMMAIRGLNAPAKARRTAEELLVRTRRLMGDAGFEDYADVLVEPLGAETIYGPQARPLESREIVLRLAVQHRDRRALDFLRKEASSAGTSMGPGTRSHFGGRSDIQGVIGVKSYSIPKALVPAYVQVSADTPSRELQWTPASARGDQRRRPPEPAAASGQSGATTRVPLSAIAHGRSGDKGEDANIGIVARADKWWPVLLRELTEARVRRYFGHLMNGAVRRYELPGLRALNFVLADSLGGGGSTSLRSDPLGKCYAQMLLDIEIDCPSDLVTSSAT